MGTIRIAEGLLYIDRQGWGADKSLLRLGFPVNRLDRTELILHHTVIVDSDATPNLWETLSEVFGKMRQLQTIRPDLGLDVPYSLVIFFMADGTLVVCEGRGLDRTGAHTYGHNTRGIGVAGEGNYELPANLGGYAPLLSRLAGWLKFDMGMENLGSSRPTSGPNAGAIAFGHRDFAATSCNGANFYKVIPSLRFAKGQEEIMALVNEGGRIYALGAMGKRHIGPTEYAGWRAMGFTATKVSKADLDKLPDWDDKVVAARVKPTGHPGATLKSWVGSYNTHRHSVSGGGNSNHVQVRGSIAKLRDDATKADAALRSDLGDHEGDSGLHSGGGGLGEAEVRAIAVAEDKKLKVTK